MRVHFNSFDEQYQYILAEACGRQACSVLILVAFDVDGMAATRMLTQLFRSDHITYMIRPVVNFDEVKSAIKTSMTKDIKSVIMVNCGSVSITVLSRRFYRILISFLVFFFVRFMISQSISDWNSVATYECISSTTIDHST
jgi:hypothetical protein